MLFLLLLLKTLKVSYITITINYLLYLLITQNMSYYNDNSFSLCSIEFLDQVLNSILINIALLFLSIFKTLNPYLLYSLLIFLVSINLDYNIMCNCHL